MLNNITFAGTGVRIWHSFLLGGGAPSTSQQQVMLTEGRLMNVPSIPSSSQSHIPRFVFRPSQPIKNRLPRSHCFGPTQTCFPQMRYGQFLLVLAGGEEWYCRCGPLMGASPHTVSTPVPKDGGGVWSLPSAAASDSVCITLVPLGAP